MIPAEDRWLISDFPTLHENFESFDMTGRTFDQIREKDIGPRATPRGTQAAPNASASHPMLQLQQLVGNRVRTKSAHTCFKFGTVVSDTRSRGSTSTTAPGRSK